MGPLDFHVLLMALDAHYPFSVTGGKRTAKRNKKVGGHPDSRHLQWMAVDVVLDNLGDQWKFVDECLRQSLQVEIEKDHIHVQVR